MAHDDGFVHVRGAKQNNLREIDLDIPRNAFVVFTGVSGSGKSSIAFETIYAEAHRRYLESIAPYARRLIAQMPAPLVSEISGLPPAVALQQRRSQSTARSTVGTLTTLSNSLRLLFSRAGSYPDGSPHPLESDAFSPNTPSGACPRCHGIGVVHDVTEESMVPDPSLSIRAGAIAAWPGAWQGKNYRDILATLGYDIDKPWKELPQQDRHWILFTEERPVVTVHAEREPHRIQRPYKGTYMSAASYVRHTFANTESATLRKRVAQFMERERCPECDGKRLRSQALAVTFAGCDIVELSRMSVAELSNVLSESVRTNPAGAKDERSNEAAAVIVADLVDRIKILTDLGLDYLSLDRATSTLSSGELQRLRLTTQLRSGLFGVIYVLDEPSAGLHPADSEALLTILHRLKESGNSLFVVEHEMDIARKADWIVDMGPGAGDEGGLLLYSGPVAGLTMIEDSITRRYLFPDQRAAQQTRNRRERAPSSWIHLRGIDCHNFRGVDASFPLQAFTAISGVSGAGKTTLLGKVLGTAIKKHLGMDLEAGDSYDGTADDTAVSEQDRVHLKRIEGAEPIRRLVSVDQRPIGRTPRSNLATYTGMFDHIRKLYASTEGARKRGYSAGHFSFNVKGGRCEACEGEGFISVELMFLPSVYAPCSACHGRRYDGAILEVTHKGLNIAQVLDLSVNAACEVLSDLPAVLGSLHVLKKVGLGYLKLGQPATDLSGGEAQRIKLASELQRVQRGRTLYLLDEPTTGMHPADVEKLMLLMHELVEAGNTVIVAENDMDVLADADWIVDLGPGAGENGGRVVACGTPENIANCPQSRTAPYLAGHLAQRGPMDGRPTMA